MRIPLIVLAWGCGAPANKQAPTQDTLPLPTFAATALEPSWSAEEVGTALTRALSTPINPDAIHDAYFGLMERGDAVCPGNPTQLTDAVLYGCDAESGVHYAGITEWIDEPMDGPVPVQVRVLAGDFWIDAPEGVSLEGGGHCVAVEGEGVRVSEVAGSWTWGGGDPWLADGFSGQLTIEAIDGAYVLVDGAAHTSGTYWSASALRLAESCGSGPTGALGLRDPNGAWYQLTFENCDPGGVLTFADTTIGTACVDFAPFLAVLESQR